MSEDTARKAIDHAAEALRRMAQRAIELGVAGPSVAQALEGAAERLLDATLDDERVAYGAPRELVRWSLDIQALTARLRTDD